MSPLNKLIYKKYKSLSPKQRLAAYWISFTLIIAFATLVRFYGLNNRTQLYGGDRVRDLRVVYDKVNFLTTFNYSNYNLLDLPNAFRAHNLKYWLPSGPIISVTWQTLSPLYYFILAPIFIVSAYSDMAAIVTTNLVGVVSVVALIYVSKIHFGKRSSIIAGLIYATSLVVVKESAIGLNPGFVAPFTILGIHAALSARKSPVNFLWISIATVGLISFHASGIIFTPIIWFFYLIQKPKIDLKNLIFGMIVVFGAVGLYVLQERMLVYSNIEVFKIYFSKSSGNASSENTSVITGVCYMYMSFIETLSYYLSPASKLVGIILLLTPTIYLYEYKKITHKNMKIFLILLCYIIVMGAVINPNEVVRTDWWFAPVALPIFTIFFANLVNLGFESKYTIPISINLILLTTCINTTQSIKESNYKDIRSRTVGLEVVKAINSKKEHETYSLNFDTQEFGGDRSNLYSPYLYLISKNRYKNPEQAIGYFRKIFRDDANNPETKIIITDKLQLYIDQNYTVLETSQENVGVVIVKP